MDSNDQNSHEMITRSKSKQTGGIFYEFDEDSYLSEASNLSDLRDISDLSEANDISDGSDLSEDDLIEDDDTDELDDVDDVDEHGNLKEFIDYKCKVKFDRDEFQKQLSILSRGQTHFSPKKRRNTFARPKNKKNRQLNDVLLSYLIMKATDKANGELKSRARKKKKREKIQLDEEILEDDSQDSKVLIVKLKDDLAVKGTDQDTSDNESFVSAQEIDEFDELDESDEFDESDELKDDCEDTSEEVSDISLDSAEKSDASNEASEDTSDEEYLFEYEIRRISR